MKERRGAPIPIPDLLSLQPQPELEGAGLEELLEISFVGGGSAEGLEKILARPRREGSSWQPPFFAAELFLEEMIADCFRVEVEGRELPVNHAFLAHVLSHPPAALATIGFRQEILAELAASPELEEKAQTLYGELFRLLSLFKAPHRRAKLDITLFRLEILEQARSTVERMGRDFAAARSGLARIAEAARAIQATREYRILTDLLDYENHLARLTFGIRLGADGRVRSLELRELVENETNPFYLPPWRRLRERFRLWRSGYDFTNRELVNRVVQAVFVEISDWLRPLLQLLGHLAFYLGALAFRRRAEGLGLAVAPATLTGGGRLELEGLFNPLLFRQGRPVPTALAAGHTDSILIVTGPNSGGKTRLLQAVGLAQILGQSGLYAPAAAARLPLVDGLFASITERAGVDEREGRLGTELLRIRSLFETVGRRSMVLLDELCSGTNPSEAEEIFLLVLRLLRRLQPVALITTHFLDFARQLEAAPPVARLEFLEVEMEGERSTYQFGPGVAATSLATHTARRLGVTFDELARLVENRRAGGDLKPADAAPAVAPAASKG